MRYDYDYNGGGSWTLDENSNLVNERGETLLHAEDVSQFFHTQPSLETGLAYSDANSLRTSHDHTSDQTNTLPVSAAPSFFDGTSSAHHPFGSTAGSLELLPEESPAMNYIVPFNGDQIFPLQRLRNQLVPDIRVDTNLANGYRHSQGSMHNSAASASSSLSDPFSKTAVLAQPPQSARSHRSGSVGSMPPPQSPGEDYSAKNRTFKRPDPPMNAECKYVCDYSADCSSLIFDTKHEWSKHVDKHDGPYRCSHPACSKLQEFTYSGGLLRHEREVHGMHGGPKAQFMCRYDDCKRHTGTGFTCKENLNEHIRRVHSGIVRAGPSQQDPASQGMASSALQQHETSPEMQVEQQSQMVEQERMKLLDQTTQELEAIKVNIPSHIVARGRTAISDYRRSWYRNAVSVLRKHDHAHRREGELQRMQQDGGNSQELVAEMTKCEIEMQAALVEWQKLKQAKAAPQQLLDEESKVHGGYEEGSQIPMILEVDQESLTETYGQGPWDELNITRPFDSNGQVSGSRVASDDPDIYSESPTALEGLFADYLKAEWPSEFDKGEHDAISPILEWQDAEELCGRVKYDSSQNQCGETPLLDRGAMTDEGYCSLSRSDFHGAQGPRYNDDTASVVTDGRVSALSAEAKEGLETLLAKELLGDLYPNKTSNDYAFDTLHCRISEALRNFAILIGVRATEGTERRAVTFVRHSRNRIAAQVREQMQSVTARERLPGGETMSVEEKLAMWNLSRSENADPIRKEQAELMNSDTESLDEFDVATIPSGPEAKAFLLDSPEYQWMISNMRNHLAATPSTGGALIPHGSFIEALSELRSSGSRTSINLDFQLEWNPREFLEHQRLDCYEFGCLGSVITISGEIEDAYATTCSQYIDERWQGQGKNVLKCVEAAILADNETAEVDFDNTWLQVQYFQGRTVVSAHGQAVNLLEIFESVVWMGAACRASTDPNQIALVVPAILKRSAIGLAFVVEYRCTPVGQADVSDPNARCWHQMFRNPVIAQGYPIPNREQGERGLELPLEMMATLARTIWATCFDGKFLLKGFNSISVPIKRIGSSVLWHLLVNQDGARMSYTACGAHGRLSSFAEAVFEGARHFLGWTEHAELIAGTASANYEGIEVSDSEEVGPGACIESKVGLTGGYFINVGLKFRRGEKDKPECFRWEVYERLIDTATRLAVVFVDTADRRHWLIDGATAVLHLSRAWLSPKQVRYAPAHKAGELRLPNLPGGPDFSYETLIDEYNRKIKLLDTASGPFTFERLAQQMFHVMEQIHDRPKQLDGDNINLQVRRRKIEGFDFKDLILEDGHVEPRSRELLPGAEDWLELSVRLETINILGSNFGELIRPSGQRDSVSACGVGSGVPSGHDLLATSFSILEKVISRHCKHKGQSIELARNLYWNPTSTSFGSCECAHEPSHRCSALVTRLHRSTTTPSCDGSSPTRSVFKKYPNGAIIFGHYPTKLEKPTNVKRKYETPEKSQSHKKQCSDSGIDMATSQQNSSSPRSSQSVDETSSAEGWSIRGAALKNRFLKRSPS